MKRVICLVVLIVSLLSITFFTVYTLMHKDINKEKDNKIYKPIVKVSSNSLDDSLSEVYNIFLNAEKYKIKLDYNFIIEKDISTVELILFMDGSQVFKDVIYKGEYKEFNKLLNNKIIGTEEKDFAIYTSDKDYFLVNLDYSLENGLRKMYIFDDNGKEISNKGIIVYDEAKNYKETDDFNLYNVSSKDVMVKIADNSIYVYEEKKNKNNLNIEEYKYTINKSKLEKELINTYENIEYR